MDKFEPWNNKDEQSPRGERSHAGDSEREVGACERSSQNERNSRDEQSPRGEQGGDISELQGDEPRGAEPQVDGIFNEGAGTASVSHRKKGFIITGVAVLILIGIIIGVRYFKKEDAEEAAVSVVPVEVAEVQTGDITKTVKLTGFVTPRSSAKLIPKLLAKISAVNVDVGDRVSMGQVLVELDDSDIKAYQKAAESSIEAARLGLKAATADLENAKRILAEVARRFSESGIKLPDDIDLPIEFPDYIKLPEIPEVDLEQLKGDLERAMAGYKQAQADYAQAEAKMKEAKTALESVFQQSNNAIITSPITGVVAARLSNPGDMANPLQPILVVIDDTEMRVAAGVTEKDINSVTKGMELQVLVKAAGSVERGDGYAGGSSTGDSPAGSDAASPNVSDTGLARQPAGKPRLDVASADILTVGSSNPANAADTTDPEQVFTGKVVAVSPVVDEKTRTFAVSIAIPNPKQKLRAGMSAEVRLTSAERRGVVRVPLDAVVDKGDHQVVYIIEQSSVPDHNQERSTESSNDSNPVNSQNNGYGSGKGGNQDRSQAGAKDQGRYCARERRVETGLSGKDYMEIISGLSPGETVVIKGQHFLWDGVPVNIKNRERDTAPVSTASRGYFPCNRSAYRNLSDDCFFEKTDHENRPSGSIMCQIREHKNRPRDRALLGVPV